MLIIQRKYKYEMRKYKSPAIPLSTHRDIVIILEFFLLVFFLFYPNLIFFCKILFGKSILVTDFNIYSSTV